MKIIIMRGLPGCGKTTYIKNNFPNAIVCSADHYFIDEEGNYKFDGSKIGEAHRECQSKFLDMLDMIFDHLIVDNTNLSLWEMAYYIGLANVYNIPVEIHRIDAPIEVCAKRNVHGVSEDKIRSMAARMEKVLPYFCKEIVIVC